MNDRFRYVPWVGLATGLPILVYFAVWVVPRLATEPFAWLGLGMACVPVYFAASTLWRRRAKRRAEQSAAPPESPRF